MAIVFACIVPHSGTLLGAPEDPTPLTQTRAAMQELAQLMADAEPEAIALITPHGQTLRGVYTLGHTPYCAGSLGGVTVTAPTDTELVDAWANIAVDRGVPVTTLIAREPETPFPLDWGALIPLALLTPQPMQIPVAVACPSTALNRSQLVAWGTALAEASENLNKRVAFIVSADQGHGHAEDGPYGSDPASAEYDAAMVEVVRDNDFARLLTWEDSWLEEAKVDSYWQTLALLGVQHHVPLRSRFLSYEVDHYFGLLCAALMP